MALSTQEQAVVNTIIAQRNQAMDIVANLNGSITVLQEQLAEKDKEIAELKEAKSIK